ncbi:MAG: FAD-dependent oxidoreductase [Myxococcales bacterium]
MLKVAIIGAGPAGFFAAAELLRVKGTTVDLFDRLPTPFGLVRHGVAPDHPDIKSVIDRYDESALAAGPRFRLLGNVEIGKDVSLAELQRRYHAVLLSYGASKSRSLGIPGEGLPGVYPASDFVGWYNGHPDQAASRFDLSAERAVVVGVGNVALDVARILLKPLAELERTDMSSLALDALARRQVREVTLLGRQGCAQAAFTPPEPLQSAEIDGTDFVITPDDRVLDSETASRLARGTLDNPTERKLDAIAKAREAARAGRKVAQLRFWTSPVAILGTSRVEGVRVARNALLPGPDGVPRLTPTGQTEDIPCGAVFTSIGYGVQPFPGVPFDAARGCVSHRRGQVTDESGQPVPGLFVAGWAKRGPRGVIGSNKPDAQETVRTLIDAARAKSLPEPQLLGEDIVAALSRSGVRCVSFPDWKLLDGFEVEAGRSEGRPRRKFTDAGAMLEALAQARPEVAPEGTGTDG